MTSIRKLRMSGILSHEDYYDFLVEVIGRQYVKSLLPRGFMDSKNEHFNDIPLKQWDRADTAFRTAGNKAMWFTMGTAKPCRAWSLSDTVCTLKALARQLRGERYHVTRDGETIHRAGTHNECFAWLQRYQPHSFHHATTHEGYAIVEASA